MPNTLPDPGVIDLFLRAFTSVFTLGWTGITPGALWIVSMLSLWCLVPYLLMAMAGLHVFLPAFITWIVQVSFIAWLLANLQTFTNDFADFVVNLGLFVGTQTSHLFGLEPITIEKFLSPGTVLYEGFNMMLPVITYVDNLSMWDVGAILMYDFFYVIPLWICFIALSFSITVAMIEFGIVAIWAIIPIAFSIFKGSAFVGAMAVAGLIGSATRLGVLALVTGVILPITFKLTIPLDGSEPEYWSILAGGAGAIFMGFAAVFAPRYASTVYGGAPAFTGSTILGLASGVAGGAIRGIQRWRFA